MSPRLTADFFRVLLLMILSMTVCGCQSLPPVGVGQGADGKTMATVKGIVSIAGLNFGYHGVNRFDITAVDSQQRGFFGTSKAMLSPGSHTIEVVTGGILAQGMTCYLTFNAEAGKVYLLRPRLINGAIGAVVVDDQTHRVIATDEGPVNRN